MRVLVAESQKVMRRLIVSCLEEKRFTVSQAANQEELEDYLQQQPDLLILDAGLIQEHLTHFLDDLKQRNPSIPVIVMSYEDILNESMEALRRGAVEYLIKPFSVETLEAAIEKVVGEVGDEKVEEASFDGNTFVRLDALPSIRRHPLMKRAVALMNNVADTGITVLISGESGVGKEIFARSLHIRSKRKFHPFVGMNCASVPSSLLEGELFGSERGAFTGSVGRRIGKFEMAQKGTLLLDEVSEMDVTLQAKLLRVIQEKELYRIGGEQRVRLDVRIVATTNRNLKEWVRQGHFREDLYYRLNVITLEIPPLRERVEDIPVFAQFALDRFNLEHKKDLCLTMGAMEKLCRYNWPGNIRELENVILRSALLATTKNITDVVFDEPLTALAPKPVLRLSELFPAPANAPQTVEEKLETLEEMERRLIRQALSQHTGNRTHAAHSLGISVRTLRNKLRLYPDLDVN